MSKKPRPRPQTAKDLGFKPRRMVRWLDPVQLARTGIRVAISAAFGEYADKREIQAVLTEKEDLPSPASEDGLWIDYVADLGDGFEPTYTLAYLLAQSELRLECAPDRPLKRGQILVMGGDQVYPAASREEYENRLIGPYAAALPWLEEESRPDLYVIPGNHDWYDGLTNFLRFFCQQSPIGAWRTRQTRSYFAVRLPANWWLWGIDIQFDAYVDEPQLQYFREAAGKLKPGHRVLLVTGKPSWTHATDVESRSYDNVTYVEEEIVETCGRKRDEVDPAELRSPSAPHIPVMLSGDDHYYARYESDDGERRQKITSGGGGAFLSATHHIRKRLVLRRRSDAAGRRYQLRCSYPTRRRSALLAWRALYRPWRSNRTFLLAIFFAYLVPAIILQVAADRKLASGEDASFWALWHATGLSKWTVYAALVLLVVLFLFAAARNVLGRLLLGGAHAAVHMAVLSFLVAGASWLREKAVAAGAFVPWFEDKVVRGDLSVAVAASAAGVLPGVLIFAGYLILCDLLLTAVNGARRARGRPDTDALGRHVTELFASQEEKGYKNFLRMHVDRDGTLTIYPIAVPRVVNVSDLRIAGPGYPDEAPYLRPTKPVKWRLLEQPIVVRRDGTASESLTTLDGQPVDWSFDASPEANRPTSEA